MRFGPVASPLLLLASAALLLWAVAGQAGYPRVARAALLTALGCGLAAWMVILL